MGGCVKIVVGAAGGGQSGRFEETCRIIVVTRKFVEIEFIVRVGFVVVTGETVTSGA